MAHCFPNEGARVPLLPAKQDRSPIPQSGFPPPRVAFPWLSPRRRNTSPRMASQSSPVGGSAPCGVASMQTSYLGRRSLEHGEDSYARIAGIDIAAHAFRFLGPYGIGLSCSGTYVPVSHLGRETFATTKPLLAVHGSTRIPVARQAIAGSSPMTLPFPSERTFRKGLSPRYSSPKTSPFADLRFDSLTNVVKLAHHSDGMGI